MHPRNQHKDGYNFTALIKSHPPLNAHIVKNKIGKTSIDFSNSASVLELNTALLLHHYDIERWTLPAGYLAPAVPGRADYVHHVADLLGELNTKKNTVLDIGTGANCIYPIIGRHEYGWKFIGSDIDPASIKHAEAIVHRNTLLRDKVNLRLQRNRNCIFKGIINPSDKILATICNPPFYKSAKDAQKSNLRKNKNLSVKKSDINHRNFQGKSNELWTPGGELAFINKMINESIEYKNQVFWFTSLVSNNRHLPVLEKTLSNVNIRNKQIVKISQGNKSSHILAWTWD